VAEETEAHEARTGAQAVERAIAIISCFDPDVDDLGLSEIATRTGLRVSTAHRIVRALVRGGLLAQDQRTERYHLGPRLAILGQSAMTQYGLDLVQPHLDELARVTGEAASLGVRDGDDVVVLLRTQSAQPLRFERPNGSRVPLHASAMGKALLAFAAVEAKAAVASVERLPRFTAHTLTKRGLLVAELEQIRERGYAVNREERHDGVCGVGAPVLDRAGVARAGVAVQGPANRFGERQVADLGQQVVAVAKAVAAELPLHRL
jgi:IclR family acetate operon transcriptional repressor